MYKVCKRILSGKETSSFKIPQQYSQEATEKNRISPKIAYSVPKNGIRCLWNSGRDHKTLTCEKILIFYSVSKKCGKIRGCVKGDLLTRACL
jgi:hypothetical protein